MARQSPAVERAVALLNFLAEAPDRSFKLTELARALDMNKATAHTLLATLSAAQWIERDSSMAYSLGPGLAVLGQAALGRDRLLHEAQLAMREFADQIGYPIVLSAPAGDEVVVVSVTDRNRIRGTRMQEGSRHPISPPWGTIFAAWWLSDEIDKWLDTMEPPLTNNQRQQYREVLDAIRRHGYVIALEDADSKLQAFLETVPATITVAQLRSSMSHLLDLMAHGQANTLEFGEDSEYRVSAITVPIFGTDGRVAVTMMAMLEDRLEGRDITRIAERMLGLSRAVSERAGIASVA